MKTRHKRLAIAAGVVLVIAAAAALILNAFQSNLVFFFSPSQIESKEAPVNRTFRLGGLVVAGSVKRTGVAVDFMVTDTAKSVPVHFEGILPDLFKEGKGVVAQGKIQDGVFVAKEVVIVPVDKSEAKESTLDRTEYDVAPAAVLLIEKVIDPKLK